MDTRSIIGRNLRTLRVERGLSQERLALAAEIDRSYVGRVERGMENVTVSTLEALAKVLAVPVGRLFDEAAASSASGEPLPAGRKPRAGKAAKVEKTEKAARPKEPTSEW